MQSDFITLVFLSSVSDQMGTVLECIRGECTAAETSTNKSVGKKWLSVNRAGCYRLTCALSAVKYGRNVRR